ncbi:BrnT family toxin [Ammonifex thiophilus]|uniref:BrnT family toxin n=1 Tax=Ammonifex thiophilus TaxID=444093 RepID=A0A3D8P8P4_9THEO|nr:BrnT family toxin [Ammonifex thiophilus]RDV84799.1 BrnT family toxin [Ammonifex thiophilus]
MRITRFEWDFRNTGHIEKKHGVRPEEVESVLRSSPLLRRTKKGRMIALGRTNTGRYLFVVFMVKPGGVARVITARDMTAAEKRYYRREKRGGGEW